MRKWNKGRPSVIEQGSHEEQLIADWMEENMGFRTTTILINHYRVEEGKIPVSRSAVMNAFDRMDPKINTIMKVCQGDTNNEAWALARKRQTKQLLIMQGVIKKSKFTEDLKTFASTLAPNVAIETEKIVTHRQLAKGRVQKKNGIFILGGMGREGKFFLSF